MDDWKLEGDIWTKRLWRGKYYEANVWFNSALVKKRQGWAVGIYRCTYGKVTTLVMAGYGFQSADDAKKAADEWQPISKSRL